jgi:hypothetical protein
MYSPVTKHVNGQTIMGAEALSESYFFEGE